jgi:hypothetical protein
MLQAGVLANQLPQLCALRVAAKHIKSSATTSCLIGAYMHLSWQRDSSKTLLLRTAS